MTFQFFGKNQTKRRIRNTSFMLFLCNNLHCFQSLLNNSIFFTGLYEWVSWTFVGYYAKLMLTWAKHYFYSHSLCSLGCQSVAFFSSIVSDKIAEKNGTFLKKKLEMTVASVKSANWLIVNCDGVFRRNFLLIMNCGDIPRHSLLSPMGGGFHPGGCAHTEYTLFHCKSECSGLSKVLAGRAFVAGSAK